MEISYSNHSSVEFHYWLNDPNSHSMDAFVQNKCEREILSAIRVIAEAFDCFVLVETRPLGTGGLRRNWIVIAKEEAKKAPITTAVIILLLTNAFSPIGKVGEKLVEKLFEDRELKQLEKQKLKLELEDLLRKQRESDSEAVHEKDTLLKKRASNFYEQLEKSGQVKAVSISGVLVGAHEFPAIDIPRSEFKNFIIASDELPSATDENAYIEIIAPVLKKGKYKWLGIYGGETIHFTMRSVEFKEMVQLGQVEFKNGSAIYCQLEIKRKIDADGEPKIVGYEVLAVNEYVENDSPIETPEGRRRRKAKEDKTTQPKLFQE